MGLMLDIKVSPKSKKSGFVVKSGQIKCYLKSAPERNKANEELIGLLSAILGLPKSKISIILGVTSQKKRVVLETSLTLNQVLEKLSGEVQLSI